MKNKTIETKCLGEADAFTEKQLNNLIDKHSYTRGETSSKLIERNGKIYQQIITESARAAKDIVIGSRVLWTDPDNGLSSGEYVVKNITGEIYLMVNDAGGECEAFFEELKFIG